MTTSAVASPYSDPRAYALRDRYAQLFGGPEIPVPVESIAEDLLGLKLEERLLDWSGMLLPAERTIVLNAAESVQNELPLRRHRFTIAHEIGHWVCHCQEGRLSAPEPSYCRAIDMANDADRALEREANIFASELLMPGAAVRAAWAELGDVVGCAAHLDVSPSAMHWRLFNFGLLETAPQPATRFH